MGDFIAHVIELVANVWKADSDLRDGSRFGESELDRKGRRFVAGCCGSIIVVLVLVALWFAWAEFQ